MKELKVMSVFLAWLLLTILSLALSGCKTDAPSTAIGENAKEQIQIAYNNLPQECKSPEREREFNLAIKDIDSLVAACEMEKVPLNQQIHYQRVLLFGLGGLSLLLFLGLLRKSLV